MMIFRRIAATTCFACFWFCAFTQNRNSVWCFGDSAGIDFNNVSNPLPIATGLRTRGSCISISDSTGNLLFYANTRAAQPNHITTLVYDGTNTIMQNGDSIFGNGWYYELITFPAPATDSLYYLFSIGVTSVFGLKYSVINMNASGGLGAVIQKNIQLQPFEMVDCITAIKHGNGRDWWLLFRRSEASTFGSNNEWHSYLVSPSGIQNYSVQLIGSQNRTNSGQICFSPSGDKLCYINLLGLVEFFDYDRCTGLLSNPETIESDAGMPPYPYTWSCAFSPDASKLYVTTLDTLSFLFQYDLNAPNIAASKDTIWYTNYPPYNCGAVKLAPDNKIYLSNGYVNPSIFIYPYPDSMYNMYNMNLSVINQPDSLGIACDFQPYSFYLGGKRTYVGLPNNPDYDLGPLAGSPCDTLTGIFASKPQAANSALHLTWVQDWEKLFVNAQRIKGRNCLLQIFDMNGKPVYSLQKQTVPPYFTQDVHLPGLAAGVYVVRLMTEKEQLTGKFIKPYVK